MDGSDAIERRALNLGWIGRRRNEITVVRLARAREAAAGRGWVCLRTEWGLVQRFAGAGALHVLDPSLSGTDRDIARHVSEATSPRADLVSDLVGAGLAGWLAGQAGWAWVLPGAVGGAALARLARAWWVRRLRLSDGTPAGSRVLRLRLSGNRRGAAALLAAHQALLVQGGRHGSASTYRTVWSVMWSATGSDESGAAGQTVPEPPVPTDPAPGPRRLEALGAARAAARRMAGRRVANRPDAAPRAA